MAVAALDRTILARDAAVVARRQHAVMRGQGAVTAGQVLGVGQGEIAEGGRKTVGAMLARHAAEQTQGIVEAARERWVTLAAQYDLGMLEAGAREGEVIETMGQVLTGDGDTEFVGVGEVGQAHAAGLLGLREDHILTWAMLGFPGGDAPLQGPPRRGVDLAGMQAGQFDEQGDRSQSWRGLQQRQDLLVPQAGERVRSGAIGPALRFDRRRARIMLKAAGGGDRYPGLRRGGCLGVVNTKSHVEPHLLVGDVIAWQTPLRRSERHQPNSPQVKQNASVGGPARVGLRPPDAGPPTAHPN